MITPYGIVLGEPDPNKPQIDWIRYTDMEPKMKNCPTCNTALPEEHAAFNLPKLQGWVRSQGGWQIFEQSKYKVGYQFSIPGINSVVEVAGLKTSYDTGDISTEGYYGGESPLPQGSEFETFVVLRIGESYFKKTGTGDSYGDVSWDGDVRAVTAKTKVIEVFE